MFVFVFTFGFVFTFVFTFVFVFVFGETSGKQQSANNRILYRISPKFRQLVTLG